MGLSTPSGTYPFKVKPTPGSPPAETDTEIGEENVLMSVIPTAELGEKLNELEQEIEELKKVDLVKFTEEISCCFHLD